MSEFMCSEGHITRPGPRCEVCGAKIVFMDGERDEVYKPKQPYDRRDQ